MDYIITFLEGIVSFISPCMLPLLPVYVSYFAAGANKKRNTLLRALFFVLGFTLVYALMGLLAGTFSSFLIKQEFWLNLVCGIIVILFGLSYMNVIRIPFFKGIQKTTEVKGVFSAFIFGIIYSVSHMPCVGAFFGSALMMASTSGTVLKGVLLLVAYSMGLGVPFLISALLIEKLGNAIGFIKKHYDKVNIICGIFLILVGTLMATGLLTKLLHYFS